MRRRRLADVAVGSERDQGRRRPLPGPLVSGLLGEEGAVEHRREAFDVARLVDGRQRVDAMRVKELEEGALGRRADATLERAAAVVREERDRSIRERRVGDVDLDWDARDGRSGLANDERAGASAGARVARNGHVDPDGARRVGRDLERVGRPARRGGDRDQRVGDEAALGLVGRSRARRRPSERALGMPAVVRALVDADVALDEPLDPERVGAAVETLDLDADVALFGAGARYELHRDRLVTKCLQMKGFAVAREDVGGRGRRGGVAVDPGAVAHDEDRRRRARGRSGQHEREDQGRRFCSLHAASTWWVVAARTRSVWSQAAL